MHDAVDIWADRAWAATKQETQVQYRKEFVTVGPLNLTVGRPEYFCL